MKNQSELESVAELRKWSDAQIHAANQGLVDHTVKRDELKGVLQAEIKSVNDLTHQLKTETNTYLDSLLYLKTVATPNCPSEETAIHQVYKDFVLEQLKPSGQSPEAQSQLAAYQEKLKKAIEVPRLISVAGFQKLFDEALNNSQLRKR